MSAVTTTALIGAGIAGGASLGGAAISAHAAGKAAQTQATAAQQIRQQAIDAGKAATDTVNTATTDANQTLTDAQKQQLALLAPYLQSGQLSLQDMQTLLGPNGPLSSTPTFSFTPSDYANDPSYQFMQQQQQQQLERALAAKGIGFGSGGFAKATSKLQAGITSTYLDDAFNRALSTYNTNRQSLLDTVGLRLNGLQNLTGMGFNAANVDNSTIGSTAAQIALNKINAGRYGGDTGLRAAEIGSEATGAAANANAAGTVAAGNAWANGLGGVANTAMLYTLPQIYTPRQSTPTSSPISSLPTFVPGVSSPRTTGTTLGATPTPYDLPMQTVQ